MAENMDPMGQTMDPCWALAKQAHAQLGLCLHKEARWEGPQILLGIGSVH